MNEDEFNQYAVGLSTKYSVLTEETALFASSKQINVAGKCERKYIPIPVADNATKGAGNEYEAILQNENTPKRFYIKFPRS